MIYMRNSIPLSSNHIIFFIHDLISISQMKVVVMMKMMMKIITKIIMKIIMEIIMKMIMKMLILIISIFTIIMNMRIYLKIREIANVIGKINLIFR